MNKGILTTVIVAILMIVGVLSYGFFQYEKETTAKYLKSEINDKDYYSLVVLYDYVKDSKQGEDLKINLKTSLADGIISRSEYKKLTGDNADLSVYEKPEYKKLYKHAKQQLILLINE